MTKKENKNMFTIKLYYNKKELQNVNNKILHYAVHI